MFGKYKSWILVDLYVFYRSGCESVSTNKIGRPDPVALNRYSTHCRRGWSSGRARVFFRNNTKFYALGQSIIIIFLMLVYSSNLKFYKQILITFSTFNQHQWLHEHDVTDEERSDILPAIGQLTTFALKTDNRHATSTPLQKWHRY